MNEQKIKLIEYKWTLCISGINYTYIHGDNKTYSFYKLDNGDYIMYKPRWSWNRYLFLDDSNRPDITNASQFLTDSAQVSREYILMQSLKNYADAWRDIVSIKEYQLSILQMLLNEWIKLPEWTGDAMKENK